MLVEFVRQTIMESMSGVNSISGKSVGRPNGTSNAKEKILHAARIEFANEGYGTSLRKIATQAVVDPSLIVHYFGNKQQLFVESMLPLFEGPRKIPDVFNGDKSQIGERLATMFILLTSEPFTRNLMLGLFKSISTEEKAAEMVHQFIQASIIDLIEHHLPGPNKKLQANIVGSQMIGLFIARYIIKVEPIASAKNDELIAYLAPRIQAHFL